MQANTPVLITLFGASGDLAARKLYPAIYRLYVNGQLSEQFALIGTARRPWSHDYFRDIVRQSIQSIAVDASHVEKFVAHFYYQPHDVNNTQDYIKLKCLAEELDSRYQLNGNRLFYLSTAPSLFPVISEHLKQEHVLSETGFNRLVIEKPFGHDCQSASILQEKLTRAFDESQIYRIDHYLGKEIVQSIYNVRFDNGLFQKQWDNTTIEQVQITLAETVGVEERGEYYETSGVTRDMIQNHMLQLLALIAMPQPQSATPEAIQQAKIDVVRHIQLDNDTSTIVRAQYRNSDDGSLIGYTSEDKVSPTSTTETYFAAQIHLTLPQWNGVPFYVRSGKRLNGKATIIDVQFKPVAPNVTGERLRFEIAPNLGYTLWLNAKKVGYAQQSTLIPLNYTYSREELQYSPDDYERLIGECIEGNRSHFAHYDEVAAAWRYIDHVHTLWHNEQRTTLDTYAANTHGPIAADTLLQQQGHEWFCLNP